MEAPLIPQGLGQIRGHGVQDLFDFQAAAQVDGQVEKELGLPVQVVDETGMLHDPAPLLGQEARKFFSSGEKSRGVAVNRQKTPMFLPLTITGTARMEAMPSAFLASGYSSLGSAARVPAIEKAFFQNQGHDLLGQHGFPGAEIAFRQAFLGHRHQLRFARFSQVQAGGLALQGLHGAREDHLQELPAVAGRAKGLAELT